MDRRRFLKAAVAAPVIAPFVLQKPKGCVMVEDVDLSKEVEKSTYPSLYPEWSVEINGENCSPWCRELRWSYKYDGLKSVDLDLDMVQRRVGNIIYQLHNSSFTKFPIVIITYDQGRPNIVISGDFYLRHFESAFDGKDVITRANFRSVGKITEKVV